MILGQCYLCGERSENALCQFCLDLMPWSGRVQQSRIGRHALNIHVACDFEEPLRRIIHALKFEGDLAAASALGQIVASAGFDCEAALLVPVPLSPQRLLERGYNQAMEVARILSGNPSLNLSVDSLSRTVDTRAQVGLSRHQRQINVKGAFRAHPGVRGQRVIVLDDVMTTGATLKACARALYRQGAAEVVAWVVAHAPLRR